MRLENLIVKSLETNLVRRICDFSHSNSCDRLFLFSSNFSYVKILVILPVLMTSHCTTPFVKKWCHFWWKPIKGGNRNVGDYFEKAMVWLAVLYSMVLIVSWLFQPNMPFKPTGRLPIYINANNWGKVDRLKLKCTCN